MNDPRELPVSYGPPQLFGSRIKETIDSLDPEMAHFANSVGAAMKKRGNVDFVMKGAFMGQTPAELAEFADAENAQQEALQMAKESMKMSGQKFEELYGQLDGEVQNRTALPEPEKAQGVSPWQAAFTLLGISAAPQNAFEIGAQPFLANDRLAKEQDQRNLIQYEQDERARKERIGLIETRMGVEESRRREAASDVDRISAELRRLSEVRYREGKQAEGKMLELRAQAYSAKDLGELRGIADFMDGLIRQNPNLAHHALRSDELLGLRGEIEKKAQLESAAEREKESERIAKEKQTNAEQKAKAFTDGVWKQFDKRGKGGNPKAWYQAYYTRQRLINEGIDPALLQIPSKEEWASPDRLYDPNSPQNLKRTSGGPSGGSRMPSSKIGGTLPAFDGEAGRGVDWDSKRMPTATDINDVSRQIKQLEETLADKRSGAGFLEKAGSRLNPDSLPYIGSLTEEIARLKKLKAEMVAMRANKAQGKPAKQSASPKQSASKAKSVDPLGIR